MMLALRALQNEVPCYRPSLHKQGRNARTPAMSRDQPCHLLWLSDNALGRILDFIVPGGSFKDVEESFSQLVAMRATCKEVLRVSDAHLEQWRVLCQAALGNAYIVQPWRNRFDWMPNPWLTPDQITDERLSWRETFRLILRVFNPKNPNAESWHIFCRRAFHFGWTGKDWRCSAVALRNIFYTNPKRGNPEYDAQVPVLEGLEPWEQKKLKYSQLVSALVPNPEVAEKIRIFLVEHNGFGTKVHEAVHDPAAVNAKFDSSKLSPQMIEIAQANALVNNNRAVYNQMQHLDLDRVQTLARAVIPCLHTGADGFPESDLIEMAILAEDLELLRLLLKRQAHMQSPFAFAFSAHLKKLLQDGGVGHLDAAELQLAEFVDRLRTVLGPVEYAVHRTNLELLRLLLVFPQHPDDLARAVQRAVLQEDLGMLHQLLNVPGVLEDGFYTLEGRGHGPTALLHPLNLAVARGPRLTEAIAPHIALDKCAGIILHAVKHDNVDTMHAILKHYRLDRTNRVEALICEALLRSNFYMLDLILKNNTSTYALTGYYGTVHGLTSYKLLEPEEVSMHAWANRVFKSVRANFPDEAHWDRSFYKDVYDELFHGVNRERGADHLGTGYCPENFVPQRYGRFMPETTVETQVVGASEWIDLLESMRRAVY